MSNSFFLFSMLLAFKHMHLISALDVFPCIPLHPLSACTFWTFFDKPPCPTCLNIVLYPSHWQLPLTVPRKKLQPPFHSDAVHLSHTSLLSPQSCPTNLRIPLPLPCKAASPSRWLPSSSNFCILVSCFRTLVKFPIRWAVQPLLACKLLRPPPCSILYLSSEL